MDNKLYYLDKYEKITTPINLTEEQLKQLCTTLTIPYERSGPILLENLSCDHIKRITKITNHIHCKAYYKENPPGSVMSAVEAANSLMYEAKAVDLFSTCYAVRNEDDQDVGIISMNLNQFKPLADKPLDKENLVINSLNLTIKKRNDKEKEKIMKILLDIQQEIMPSLDRNPDPGASYFRQFVRHAPL